MLAAYNAYSIERWAAASCNAGGAVSFGKRFIMTSAASAVSKTGAAMKPAAAPWLAALAIVPILGTVYQTMVLTDVTGDVIRKGINGDRYSMIWTNACWMIAMLYGMFGGLWAAPRFGSRITIQFALAAFALGNLLCGAAVDVATMSAAKLVEGVGKGMAATPAMAASTVVTTWFHRRALRHVWQLISVLGSAACLWWMSSLDNFTAKGQIALLLGCWGAFAGLLPPAFLQDEVEGLDPGDKLYGAAVGNAVLISALMVIPSLTNTIISAWTDRALDVERMNLRENRPEVAEASARMVDYYQRRGMQEADASRMASTALGRYAHAEAAAHGIRRGLRMISALVAAIGVPVTVLLIGERRVDRGIHRGSAGWTGARQ